MKKLIDAYCRLLTWLMVATVAILVVPVTLQMIGPSYRAVASPRPAVARCTIAPVAAVAACKCSALSKIVTIAAVSAPVPPGCREPG